MKDHFEILVLLARPAAGKSEVIHYLKSLSREREIGKVPYRGSAGTG